MSEANDSEGGRAWEDSCCAMNKERVNSNGCEKVSTLSDSDRGEERKVDYNKENWFDSGGDNINYRASLFFSTGENRYRPGSPL